MTDKQIIIDDYFRKIVDINGKIVDYEIKNSEVSKLVQKIEKYNSYIELKEQECDMWKNLTIDNGAVALKHQQQLDQLEAENDKLREIMHKDSCTHYVLGECSQEHHSNCVGKNQCIKDLEQECEELKEKVKKYGEINKQETKDYAELKAENDLFRTCHDNEQSKRRKYGQAIEDIKEIAKKTLNMVDYKTYFKRDNKSLKQEGFKALNEILQKISEVEK